MGGVVMEGLRIEYRRFFRIWGKKWLTRGETGVIMLAESARNCRWFAYGLGSVCLRRRYLYIREY
jgi:hypothetical protein